MWSPVGNAAVDTVGVPQPAKRMHFSCPRATRLPVAENELQPAHVGLAKATISIHKITSRSAGRAAPIRQTYGFLFPVPHAG
jgi:hypothetical protein